MTLTAADAITAVQAGPSGPEVGAFFDLDGTLVEGFTGLTFYQDQVRRREVGPGDFARTVIAALDGNVLGGDPTKVADLGIRGLRGRSEDELAELGERLFVQKLAATIRPEARDLVRAHRRMGHTVAVSSAATTFQVAPIARDLGIEHLICSRLAADDGILTGEIDGGMLWGEGKAKAVRAFARSRQVDLKRSYGYANGDEDIAFLSTVGTPVPLNPARGLRAAAEMHGWPVLTLREPRKAGLRSVLGLALASGGMNVGIGVGAITGLLHRDRRFAVNAGIPIACDLALAMAGIKLQITGEHNLWRARPAVFVFNHQSSLDALISGALVRRDFTGVAKREARNDPRMLLATLLLDPAYIDRGNSEQARAQLGELGERIKAGTSVVIAPEGTRTPTPVLKPFKRGAFHIAAQAGVPIVPIVIRNAGELMWRRAKVPNSGTVQIAVLDPIPTDAWTTETVGARADEIRQLFADTLDDWPAS